MSGIEDPVDDLKVTPPKTWATGLPAVAHALEYSLGQTSPRRTALTLLNINQPKGIDCPGCAWPEPAPGERHRNEYCENGAKHINDEAASRRVTRDFFREHSIAELDGMSDYWLNQQGRLTEPMVKRPGATHYEPIGWDEALGLLADALTALDSPDEALFYVSGRPLFAHVRTGRWAGIVPHTWLHVFGVPHGMRAVPMTEPARSVPVGLVTVVREPESVMARALREVAGRTDVAGTLDRLPGDSVPR